MHAPYTLHLIPYTLSLIPYPLSLTPYPLSLIPSLRSTFGALIAVLMLVPCALAAVTDPDVAIYARAYNGYERTLLADKSIKPETYVFAEGGRFGGIAGDKSLDTLTFTSVIKTLAGPLRKRSYVPSFDAKKTDFIILVFWGMTNGVEGSQFNQGERFLMDTLKAYASRPSAAVGAGRPEPLSAEANLDAYAESEKEQAMMMQSLFNAQRDQHNFSNARILGFREEFERAMSIPWFSQLRDVVTDLESDRYFVVLKAYDFRTRVDKKSWRLIWELRYSIPARGVAFDQHLAEMTKRASKYFGQDLHHLIREEIKEGKVDVGTPTVVESDTK